MLRLLQKHSGNNYLCFLRQLNNSQTSHIDKVAYPTKPPITSASTVKWESSVIKEHGSFFFIFLFYFLVKNYITDTRLVGYE